MLVSLHVRNLALIEETEVFFQPGLNILTGETGAGKSVILGSVALALGAKADRDMIRTGAEYALIELTFEGSEEVREALRRMDLPAEDNQIIYREGSCRTEVSAGLTGRLCRSARCASWQGF